MHSFPAVAFAAGAGPVPRVSVPERSVASEPAARAAVRIVSFSPPSGVFGPGEQATASIEFTNRSGEAMSCYVGYSVRDDSGRWHDAPFTGPVALAASGRGASAKASIAWKVTDEAARGGGRFAARMAVWSGPPGSASAARLVMSHRERSFSVRRPSPPRPFRLGGIDFVPTPDTPRPARNRGSLRSSSVVARAGEADVVVKSGTLDGGEFSSVETFGRGRLAVRAVSAGISRTVTGIFLYDPATEDEITIEIFNDGSRRIWMSTFIAGGEPAGKAEAVLPFDPAGEAHEYSIIYSEKAVRFEVDGKEAGYIADNFFEGRRAVPRSVSMRIMCNLWFPGWDCFAPGSPPEAPGSDLAARFFSIGFAAEK